MDIIQMANLLAYYKGSEVRITADHHPHYNAVGEVTGSGYVSACGPGLIVKRFDTQESFYVFDENHIKITKRK